MLRQIILRRLFTHLVWLTLFMTCSVTYTCHQNHRIPICLNTNEVFDNLQIKQLYKFFAIQIVVILTIQTTLSIL